MYGYLFFFDQLQLVSVSIYLLGPALIFNLKSISSLPFDHSSCLFTSCLSLYTPRKSLFPFSPTALLLLVSLNKQSEGHTNC
mmetsp:Transcript_14245/g.28592  ORF Transcript_14245/g.28592 Transcript_14245/m.28592 type:complete len:82 (+) Transcript_14245:43-288(+)